MSMVYEDSTATKSSGAVLSIGPWSGRVCVCRVHYSSLGCCSAVAGELCFRSESEALPWLTEIAMVQPRHARHTHPRPPQTQTRAKRGVAATDEGRVGRGWARQGREGRPISGAPLGPSRLVQRHTPSYPRRPPLLPSFCPVTLFGGGPQSTPTPTLTRTRTRSSMAAARSGAAYAFVTLVTTDEYLPAALVAAHSLRLAHDHSYLLSTQDKIALAGDDASQDESLPQLGPWHKDKAASSPQPSNIDLVALVTPATLSVQTIRVLLTVFDRVIGVEPLGVESILAMQQLGQLKAAQDGSWEDVSRRNTENLALLGRIDLGMSAGAALTKLHAWRLTDYQKVVYLDADVLVLVSRNSEAIFTR